jgi:capsular polysaccharide biosynthesis protein
LFVTKKQVLDFREIRRMLWRRRLLIVAPLVVTMAYATWKALTAEDSYISTVTLAPENPLPLTQRIRASAAQRGDGGLNIRTRITSSRFLEAIAVQIGIHENAALRARAEAQVAENPGLEDVEELVLRQCVIRLRQMVKVSTQPGGLIQISAVSSSPKLAQMVATVVAEHYLNTIKELRISGTEEAMSFARSQLEIAEASLQEKQDALRRFQQEKALEPLSQSPVKTGNLTRVQQKLADARAEVEAQRERLATVARQIQAEGLGPYLDLGLLESEKVGGLKQTLMELERSIALAQVDPVDQTGTSLQTQAAYQSQRLLAELEDLAAAALPSLPEDRRRPIVDHEFLQIAVDAAGAREDALRRFLDEYADDLASMPADDIRLKRLEEEVESALRVRQTWVEQLNASALSVSVLSAEGIADKLIILERAVLPSRPFAPNRQQILLVAVAMGIALGIGAAVVTEYFDLTLKSVEEIEAVLEAPILGAVPRMQASVQQQQEVRRRRRLWIFVSSSAVIVLALAAAGLYYFKSQG